MSYAMTVTVDHPFEATVGPVRSALAGQGFGVLTEIDLSATLKARLGVDIPSQLILGACNPPLAHAALLVEESVGVLLPCNVVIRSATDDRTVVDAVDPRILVELTGNDALAAVAADAGSRLAAALHEVEELR